MKKTRDFLFFMTKKDEELFCKNLREDNNKIYFLDTKPTPDGNIDNRIFDCITKSTSPFFSIVNFDLITKSTLSNSFEKHENYYHFSQVGEAQMQLLRSKPDMYLKDCLQHGRIADSYDPNNTNEKKWKNDVYKILKKTGDKIHWFYSTSDGFEIKEKPENRLVALPDAKKEYNGRIGNFMVQNITKFVASDISLSDIKVKHPINIPNDSDV